MARRNLVPNPSFETGLDGWTSNGTTFNRETGPSTPQAGAYYAYFAHTSSGDLDVFQNSTNRSVVEAGTSYTASLSINRDSTSTVRLNLAWFDSSDAVISGVSTDHDPPDGAWARLSITATAPAGAVRGRLQVFCLSQPANFFARVDAAMIEPGSTLGSYADGDTPGWAWDGTAHASSSQQVDPDAPWWEADLTAADTNLAGFKDTPYERQTAAGNGDASGLPWPIEIVDAPGGRAGRAVPYALPAEGRRYETQPGHTQFSGGETFFFGQAFYLPAGFPTGGGNYQVITQLRQQDTQGSPVAAFEILGGELRVTGGYGIDGDDPARLSYSRTLLASVATERWYNLVYRVQDFSTAEATSVLDVWVDGTQVLDGYVIPPPTVIGGGTYRKTGLYRDPNG